MENVVIKKLSNNFWVRLKNGEVVMAKPRGTLKSRGIFVGDKVEVYYDKDDCMIEKVLERKNLLIRPPLANLDKLVIVMSCVPKPDFYVLDKLLLFSYSYGIEPIVVINKQDISQEINDYIDSVYGKIVDVVHISAKTGQGFDNLKVLLKDKLSALVGQSAVGKSAIINSLVGKNFAKEGDLSKKVNRGKNTTRHCEIFIKDDFLIADTAGFTALDETLLPIPYFELHLYYKDYLPYVAKCKYSDCKHVNESVNDCAVKRAVQDGELDAKRYKRYTEIYKILEQRWVKTHG